jgi:cyclohexanecarboxylate-CoA ligase
MPALVNSQLLSLSLITILTNMALAVQQLAPGRSEAWRAQGFWRDDTVYGDLVRTATADPARVAIVSWRHDRGEVETLTYGELLAIAQSAAAGLRRLGVRPGDVVSLQLPNWWQFTALHLACARVGAVTHPMSPILGRREVIAQLRAATSRVLVVPDHHRSVSYRVLALEVQRTLPELEHVLIVGDTLEPVLFDLGDSSVDQHPPAGADDPCELQFTSGTTGHPKGVVHTHNSAYAGVRSVATALGLTSQDTVVMPATFGHQTGFLFGCCLPVMLGATAVIQDEWAPDTMLELADSFGATWTSMPPPMVLDLCAAAEARGRRGRTLKFIRTSGGPVPWALAARTQRAVGAELLPSWGLTETGACTMRRPHEPDGLGATDGVPLPGVELRLRDHELAVRSPGLLAGYLGRDTVRPAPEWFRTGDLARSDGRGGFLITGRIKDLIIRGGENIPVAEIEAMLGRHDAVAEVAVVAVPDPRLGERACAVVVAAPGMPPTLPALTELLAAAGVTKQFWPERLVLVPALPRTSNGKFARGEIRAIARTQVAGHSRERAAIDGSTMRRPVTR